MHIYEYFQSAFRILYGYSLQLARMAYFELEKYRNRIPETCVGESMFLTPLTVISFSCVYHQSLRQTVASHRDLRIIEAWLKHIFLNPVRQILLVQTVGWGEGCAVLHRSPTIVSWHVYV